MISLADLKRGDRALLDGEPVRFLCVSHDFLVFTREDGTDVAIRIRDAFGRVSLQGWMQEVLDAGR